jgi:hypothetical protein
VRNKLSLAATVAAHWLPITVLTILAVILFLLWSLRSLVMPWVDGVLRRRRSVPIMATYGPTAAPPLPVATTPGTFYPQPPVEPGVVALPPEDLPTSPLNNKVE